MRTSPLVAIVALLLASAAAGQEPIPYGEIHQAKLSLLTGELEILGPWTGPPAADAPGLTYANAALTGTYAPTDAQEWLDWGYKDSGGASGPVTSFVIGYATTVCQGAPGAGPVTLEVAFFTGTMGGCQKGTEVARYTIANLPGDTNCGDTLGTAWILTVELELDSFYLPDGTLGFSYTEVGTTGETGPLLVTPQALGACFFASPPPPGTKDCFDKYAPPGSSTCLGTFQLATDATSSFFLRIFEESGTAASVTPRLGTPPNPGTLASTQLPILGQAYDPAITVDAIPSPMLDVLLVSLAPSTPLSGVPTAVGTFLIDPSAANLVAAPSQPSGSAFALPVPIDSVLIGLTISAQGGQIDAVGGAVGLTNAEDLVLGTL